MRGRNWPWLLLLALAASCQIARPSGLPRNEDCVVAVKSARLPGGEPWYSQFAHHTWIDYKDDRSPRWHRIEVMNGSSGVVSYKISANLAFKDWRWGDRDVRVLASFTGERARSIAERIEKAAQAHHREYLDGYLGWPGPNSNTLFQQLAREVPELAFAFHHNAVGKDYPGWAYAGLTNSKTGVRFDTIPLGAAIGLEEGIEIHVLQFAFGLRLFPPRIELPFLPEIPWSDTPERPKSTLPSADATLTLGEPDTGAIRMSSPFLLNKTSGCILFVNEDGGEWIRVSYSASPNEAGQRSIRFLTEKHGETEEAKTEQTIPCDEKGSASTGSLVVGNLTATLEVTIDPLGWSSGRCEISIRR